ncbi:MAG TPA: monovalent cation/H(+) antiporter subunit G [Acidimicrobiales bacterium]|nr:monovalent cation/H(+) antiporter subunit G [Acidimicrobiales bacterium]
MVGDALVAAGTAVIVAASLAALVARDSYTRLHLATPMTSLGGPLIAAGLSIANGPGLTTASIALPTGLLFIAGPMLSSAIARMLAQRDGKVPAESPE